MNIKPIANNEQSSRSQSDEKQQADRIANEQDENTAENELPHSNIKWKSRPPWGVEP
jgi:hypothetical protein